MEITLVGDKKQSLRIQLNAPTPGDDPNNRFDCDACAYTPTPDEPIILVLHELRGEEEIRHKICTDCALDILQEGFGG